MDKVTFHDTGRYDNLPAIESYRNICAAQADVTGAVRMSFEILPGLRDIVQSWVVKKEVFLPPRRLTDEDIEVLAKASIETLKQRAVGELASEWGSLQTLTASWIVQRQRGQIPFPLRSEEYRVFVELALKGLLTPVRVIEAPQNPVEVSDGMSQDAVLLDEDAFRFAREHLARCL
ncbi:hypothetical protein GFGA_1d0655 [Gluconobacter frateurii NBRC 103465]|nr:hypothetical protein GFGA_1d0655 [Gluconobacter frateurii NBRC 103465]